MGKFELPIIDERELCGLHFTIRAVPYSVAKLSQGIGEDAERMQEFLAAVWDKCVSVGEGETKPALEDMPLSVLNEIISTASDTNADFRKPLP